MSLTLSGRSIRPEKRGVPSAVTLRLRPVRKHVDKIEVLKHEWRERPAIRFSFAFLHALDRSTGSSRHGRRDDRGANIDHHRRSADTD